MFATLASDYPVGPLPGGTDDLRTARAWAAEGRLSTDAYRAFVDAWVTSIVDEQVASGLSLVCDAGGRWERGLVGLAGDLLAGRCTPADIVDAWRLADRDTNVLTKQVLPGPWSCSLALASTAADRTAIRRDLIGVLAETTRVLVAAGCPVIQLDEPAATGAVPGPDDSHAGGQLLDTIERSVAAMPKGTSVCVAFPGGPPRPELHDAIAALPVQSVLVDVTHGPDGWRCIDRLSPDQGVIVGALDATSAEIDDPEMLLWAGALAARMADRGTARVGIAPSGSLAGLDRHHARRKIEQLGMAVRLAAMGPLQAVAAQLQPDPATARIRRLPELYRDWQEATRGT